MIWPYQKKEITLNNQVLLAFLSKKGGIMSKKRAVVKGVKLAAIAIASAAVAAKKIHDKGYDKKAATAMKKVASKIKAEAKRFETLVHEEIRKQEQANKKKNSKK